MSYQRIKELRHTMNFDRILKAARNSAPSPEQLKEWEKRNPSKEPRNALTGWTGRTLTDEEIEWAEDYAEPGYSAAALGILFANWNDVSRRVQDILERAGYSLEWSSEWSTCCGCGKAVRTRADSYEWQASYAIVNDCELFCADCIAKDAESYLKKLEDNPKTAIAIRQIDPAKHGYVELESDFKHGLHLGQNDNTKEIYKRLHNAGHKRLVFKIDSVGQFDMSFSIWKKQENEENEEGTKTTEESSN